MVSLAIKEIFVFWLLRYFSAFLDLFPVFLKVPTRVFAF